MRIAFVSQPFDVVPPDHANSVGLVTHHLAAALAQTDEVTVYASLDCPGNRGSWAGIPGVTYRLMPPSRRDQLVARAWSRTAPVVGALRGGMRPPYSTSGLAGRAYTDAVAADLARHPVDVVHVQHATQLVPAVRRAAPDALVALHAQGPWFPQTPASVLERRLDGADLLLACSDFVRDEARRMLPRLADRCRTVHDGVDVAGIDDVARRTSPVDGPPFVLTLGAVSPHKGVHDALAAFIEVARHRPDLHLRIVGPPGAYPIEEICPLDDHDMVRALRPLHGPGYARRLEAMVPADLAGRVHFTDRLPRDGVVRHLLDAEVMLFPSIWDEGFGLPAIEALAAGTPVVATRSGAVPELVIDGENGVLVDKSDVTAMVRALDLLLDDPDARRRFGAAGRARAQERFDWPVVADHLRRVYSLAQAR
jgi:glycosyltransferase involved in cell wall biosynthesis